MAQGYLRSVGMGEFTPKTDMYSKEQSKPEPPPKTSTTTRWKKLDDDLEFEFDI